MGTRSALRCTVLVAAVLPVLAACGGTTGAAKRTLQDVAVQKGEVTGLSLCPQSGSPDAVARALREGGSGDGADRVASTWSDDRGAGGQEAYIVGYAASASDCLRIFASYGTGAIDTLTNKWVVNYVVAYRDDRAAQAKWAQRASYLQNFENTTGKSTGLGDHATVLDAYPGQWYAVWTEGSSFSVLATNYDAPAATTLATHVAARMHQ